MSDQSKKPAQGPAGPKLSELADAAGIGLERKILTTLYDTLFRPGRAARAAFDRADDHISQLKLFGVLAGLFFSAGALFGAPMTPSIEALTAGGNVEAAYASITAQGADPAVVNDALSRWGGLLAWPITLIASAVFIIVLKLVKPSLTWFGHVLVYLIATNAMTLVAIPLVAGRLVSMEVYLTLQFSTLLIFFVQMMRLGASALGLGAGRLIVLFMLMAVAVFPTILISGLLQFAAIWVILEANGVSMLEMMEATSAAAPAAGAN
jgi:hypothetical protein